VLWRHAFATSSAMTACGAGLAHHPRIRTRAVSVRGMQGTRMAGAAAIVTGAMFAAGEALSRFAPDFSDVECNSGFSYLANIIDFLKYGLMGVTILLLLSICGKRISKTGRAAAALASGGSIITGVANGIEHCLHIESLGILYGIALLIGVPSTIVFGLFVARSREVSPWIGWTISVGVFAFLMSKDQAGAVIAAVAWVVIGVRLIGHADTDTT
jgi:hypothetical protein